MKRKLLYSEIDRILAQLYEMGHRKFVIFGFSSYGWMTKEILNTKYQIQELAVIDNGLCKENPTIYPTTEAAKYQDTDVVFLITNKNSFSNLVELLKEQGIKESQIVSLFYTNEKKDILFYQVPVGMGTYGYHTFLNVYTSCVESIGRFCSISEDAYVVPNHPLDAVTTHSIIFQQKPLSSINKKVVIGNDVWIGRNVIITQGVRIGNGAVIGAGAIVTKDVPPYGVVAGVPAKVIRYRMPSEQRKKMEQIAWWNWSYERIVKAIPYMTDVEDFIHRYGGMENDNDKNGDEK